VELFRKASERDVNVLRNSSMSLGKADTAGDAAHGYPRQHASYEPPSR
jgi:hypothetical protein